MSENRNRFRKHIRAAKEWLGRAECSMDKKNDIRGDLNFMLAQAELRRAQETRQIRSSGLRWFRHGLSLLAAGSIVFGCMLFFQARHATVPVQVPQQTASTQEVLPPVETESSVIAPQEASTTGSYHQEEPVLQDMSAAKDSNEAVSAPPSTVVQEKPVQQKVNMPSEDMQKLMQSAGKNLRAH